MLSDKEHFRQCILFAFQLKKNAAEANEIDLLSLGRRCDDTKHVKSGSRDFATLILTFPNEKDLVSRKNSKTRNWSNSWSKILLKWKKNLHELSESLSKQFAIACSN